MLVTTRPIAPLGISASHADVALVDGARLVDVRTQADRNRDGVISGAIALGVDVALDRLTPGSPSALRDASAHARWIVVATDGHDAEWLTWHLHARGVTRARFLLGGFASLRRPSGVGAPPRQISPSSTISTQDRRDLAIMAAH